MAENATASQEATMPAFVRAGMDFFTGKTVLASTLAAETEKLNQANARIAELEKVDVKALTDRIAVLEGDVKAKDETISAHEGTIKALQAEAKTASRQAQQQLVQAGAQAPVVTESPKTESTTPEADQFLAHYTANIGKGMKKSDAIAAIAKEFPKLHTAFIQSGKKLS